MDTVVCEDCDRPKVPDETGQLRCKPCDEAVEEFVRSKWEEAVANGELWAMED